MALPSASSSELGPGDSVTRVELAMKLAWPTSSTVTASHLQTECTCMPCCPGVAPRTIRMVKLTPGVPGVSVKRTDPTSRPAESSRNAMARMELSGSGAECARQAAATQSARKASEVLRVRFIWCLGVGDGSTLVRLVHLFE